MSDVFQEIACDRLYEITLDSLLSLLFCYCFKYLPHYVAQNNQELKILLPLPLEY